MIVPLAEADVAEAVGGKAASLGRLIRAGFPVPNGFVILPLPVGEGIGERGDGDGSSVDARTTAENPSPQPSPPRGEREILAAYAAMGGGTVAVRSSATAEDGATSSMAGQFETVLNVEGDAALLNAVRHCRASVDSDRVWAYAAERGIDAADVRMAVIVQRQVAADVAGVLFTASPDAAFPRQMLIEAAWGLGESVVGGRVQPDVLRVTLADGRVVEATIATKRTELTRHGEREVEPCRQERSCLTSEDVHQLWQLARRAETHFGCPQDLEWAIADGQLYLLQSRPITTHADAAETEAAIIEARDAVRQMRADGRGPWVVHNLAETLPRPTPLTWSVVCRFMSADGGYGRAYRRAGFDPQGEFLDLVGGRIYMDASRAPRMFGPDFPFAYDVEVLRTSPDASQQPPTIATGSFLTRWRAARTLRRVDTNLGRDLLPLPLAEGVGGGVRVSENQPTLEPPTPPCPSGWEGEHHGARWRALESAVMDDTAAAEVLAGLHAGRAMQRLRDAIAEYAWDEDAAGLAGLLSSGGPADASVSADAALYDVGQGRASVESWLADHGHRGVGEMELASPRWRERPDAARQAAARLAARPSPDEQYRRHVEIVERRLDELCRKLSSSGAADLRQKVGDAQRAVAARENAKATLMRGYDDLRKLALAIGNRLGVGDGVFFLSREEMLDAMRVGYAPLGLITQRRRRYDAGKAVRWPAFIDSADAIGVATPVNAGGALAISAGVATGPARIMLTPDDPPPAAGEVLVCPSTDPAWTPVLAGAAALVIEVGGVLSHGAVVARELGVPAVVLPDATRRFRNGDVVRVDGDHGRVELARSEAEIASLPGAVGILPTGCFRGHDAHGTRKPSPPARVPPPGAKDRRAARLRNAAAIGWGVFLLGFFLLPETAVRRPTLAAFDAVLWPIGRLAGWPITVVLVAATTAVVTLLLQRTLTDNRRLLETKCRAAAWKSQHGRIARDVAVKQDTGEPSVPSDDAVVRRAVAALPARALGASLVPVGLLLGPMVVMFVWLGGRADPSAWNAPAGAAVRIVATVDGEWTKPLTLAVPAGVTVDESTPAEQPLPPLRTTLEHLLSLYREPASRPAGEPWELSVAPDPSRRAAADDLQAYLDAGLPPQAIAWVVRPGDSFDGRFVVSITTPDDRSRAAGILPAGTPRGQDARGTGITAAVTVGPSTPPSPAVERGRAGSPIESVRVVYPPPKAARSFLRIFGSDVGWLGVYVGVYVLTLVVVRRAARVA